MTGINISDGEQSLEHPPNPAKVGGMQPDDANMDQPGETVPEQPTEVERERPEVEREKERADEAEEGTIVGAGRKQP